jgi:serine phosphatase RsbU (regulator of sigma subunit)
MKNLIYSFVIVSILFNKVIAQSALPINVSDSLWHIWQDNTRNDSIRVDAFADYIWKGYVFSNPDSAIYFSKIEYEFSKENHLLKRTGTALYHLGIASYLGYKYDNGIDYFLELIEICSGKKYNKLKSYGINGLGLIYTDKGEYEAAINYYKKSNDISIQMKDTIGQASAFNNIAMVYSYQGNYSKSIQNYFNALKFFEIKKDSQNIANCYNNIAIEYKKINAFDKAIVYYNKSINVLKKINQLRMITTINNNLGNIYFSKQQYNKALSYYKKSYTTAITHDNRSEIAKSLSGMGNVYIKYKKFDSAQVFIEKSLNQYTEIGDKYGMLDQVLIYGNFNYELKRYKKAIQHFENGYSIAKEIGIKEAIKKSNNYLWKAYKNIGNYKKSLFYYEAFIKMKDSLESERNIKEILEQEFKYSYQKQAAVDSISHLKETALLDANILQQDLELKNKKQQQYLLFGGITLLVIFGGFMFNRFKITKKQNKIIELQKQEVELQKQEAENQRDYAESEHKKAEDLRIVAETQKEIVEEKNKEITDSITYAKRLQNAILPPARLVKEWLNDSFIFYKPKDIVAGDFYWMEVVKRGEKNIIFYAAADCTGHGVPGAMVSVVCSNALNRSVKEFNITDPAKLLDKVTELVKDSFAQSDEAINDGMDIAICALDLIDKKVWFSGANNPLYRITGLDTKIDGDYKTLEVGTRQLIEYKADKQPIGNYDYIKPFTTTEIQLEPGDCIYIFSDGFSDQFGGEKGKKYKSANFKRFLMQIESKEMDVQKEILDTEINRWRGEIEQVDDICVIGLRVNGHMSKIFTKRELEILKNILDGKTSQVIAEELFISKHTVDTHRKRILAKSNTKNALELSKFCETHSVIG